MKYILWLLFLVTACSQNTWSKSTPAENPSAPPTIIARGTGESIEWMCQLEELNSSLACVKCDFHNKTPTPSVSNSCINVSFYDNRTGSLVVESRQLCSGPLRTEEISSNYAIFRKESRVALRKCGELLDLCVMLADPVSP